MEEKVRGQVASSIWFRICISREHIKVKSGDTGGLLIRLLDARIFLILNFWNAGQNIKARTLR